MTAFRNIPLAFLLALLVLAGTPAAGQGILVTTGEHADFTRVVLQSARPIEWQLHPATPGSPHRRLSVAGAQRPIDLSRAFQRIPRTRLADLVRTPEGLELRLDCECPIEAWTERDGLVVLDIANPGPVAAPAPQRLPPAALPTGPRFTQGDLARTAGAALARTWQAGPEHPGMTGPALRQGPPPSPIGTAEMQAIMQQLSTDMAGALTQGILDPSPNRAAQTEMLRLGDGDGASAIPPNLRVTSVLDRPDESALLLPDDHPPACAPTAALDFVTAPAPGSFNTALAAGLSRWVGEFDQPEPGATEALVTLYLQHGFGAEARALIENATHPLPGRDLLLGVADTLEGRQSNSRLRLAEQHGCGGAAAFLAALAGAPATAVRAQARDIAGTFGQAPGVVRAAQGGALIRILVEADAIDSARVVADSLRRTPLARDEDLHLVDAILDRARGEVLQAGARLSYHANEDVEAVLLRLQIALETGADVPPSVLLDAEAIAGSHRAAPEGADLMAALVRLRVAAGEPVKALELLDRLNSWGGTSARAQADGNALDDIVWFGLALQASDPELLELVLNRNDWRDPAFSAETRAALAERLLGFGLTEAAQALLAAPHTPLERHLLARLHLGQAQPDQAQPDQALSVLSDDDSIEALSLRADALRARGDNRAASQLFAGLGAFDDAARSAVLARDWRLLEDAWAAEGDTSRVEVARALARVPDAERRPAGTEPDYGEAPAGESASEEGNARPTPALLPIAGPAAAASVDSALPAAVTAAPPASPAPLAARTAHFSADARDFPSSAVPGAMARSAALLSESEALRATFAPLLEGFEN